MKAKVLKNLFLSTALSFSFMAQVEASSHKIMVDDFSYVGSLGNVAENVEAQLAEKAAMVCGSLENIARLKNISFQIIRTSITDMSINVHGTAGAKGSEAIFIFSYPRMRGSADVICKN